MRTLLLSLLLSGCAHLCSPITTIRFVGTPGTTIVYAGERYTLPESGTIELLAKRKVFPAMLNASAPDQFGTVTVVVER